MVLQGAPAADRKVGRPGCVEGCDESWSGWGGEGREGGSRVRGYMHAYG